MRLGRVVVVVLVASVLGGVGGCADVGGEPPPTPPPVYVDPEDPVDRSRILELDARVRNAMLPVSDVPLTGAREIRGMRSGRNRLQEACNVSLRTDGRVVRETGKTWTDAGKNYVFDHFALVYDRPVAMAAVGEAEAALACGTYRTRDGRYTVTGRLDLPPAVAGSPSRSPASAPAVAGVAVLAFCEATDLGGKKGNMCTVIVGGGDLACSARAWAPEESTAKDLIVRAWPAVRRVCW